MAGLSTKNDPPPRPPSGTTSLVNHPYTPGDTAPKESVQNTEKMKVARLHRDFYTRKNV